MIDQLIDQLSTLEAVSIEGAITQLIAAHRLIQTEFGSSDGIRLSDEIKIQRLVYSVINCFAKIQQDEFPEAFYENHMDPHLDPWKEATERLAIVEQRQQQRKAS